jgi:hypothetical protein
VERFPKGEGSLFKFCDLINKFLFEEFHFNLMLAMKLGLLPFLHWMSGVYHKEIMNTIAEIKEGEKAL